MASSSLISSSSRSATQQCGAWVETFSRLASSAYVDQNPARKQEMGGWPHRAGLEFHGAIQYLAGNPRSSLSELGYPACRGPVTRQALMMMPENSAFVSVSSNACAGIPSAKKRLPLPITVG